MSGLVCRAAAVALSGLSGTAVMVEAAVSQQLPGMAIIGLPDTALAEAKLRVRTATAQLGLPLSDRFLTVNLSPASLPKHGSGFDLAIALAALAASRQLPAERLAGIAHIGELGLGGELRRPAGLLSAVIAARGLGFSRVMVPASGGGEAALVPGIEVVAVADLTAAVAWYRGGAVAAPPATARPGRTTAPGSAPGGRAPGESGAPDAPLPDLADVVGQEEAVEAIVIAAAGRHHLSLSGPPGSGKTLLASRLRTILPELGDEESLEASSIASLGGAPLTGLIRIPPFESPHHTASQVSIIGGGSGAEIRPGAITRASHGVLLLDEAPEFSRHVLEALRQPLESGVIDIHRARVRTTLPAKLQLVLTANPCPCGNAGAPDTALQCRCSPSTRVRYQQRISGPLADRLDLRLTLHRVARTLFAAGSAPALTSASAGERVAAARSRALERLRGTPWRVNAEVTGAWLRSPRARLPRSDTAVLDRAIERGALTARGYHRTLRIAWSIADLAGRERPGRDEVAQALVLRGGGPS
ncbi:YifB family Mg chelatase-like AAA ATPase [Leucobacter allii]|uniref:YifB family Mg chelatase-like AAA ATPase n=1 Tax=Leucobacter allii TaxID=2932247 RepID=A0ABY4FIG6_9MICO|nr:YifB family Mg chelatase-like AAA ATPase [Leucobacter allii]UOQ55782.1 YifB family Mg chelatase-like AAA ATPase [Leucobacter allii]UOR00295.1 YifB family Mg chelatase-like AAA ATPase [Leucobacter allii]